LCIDLTSELNCLYTSSDSEQTLHEWSIIYRIHSVSQPNYFLDQNNTSQDNAMIENVNITMEISYVPNGMDEGNRTNVSVVIELYSSDAPNHVDSFLTHIENGNYDSAIFHRIIDNFMIQGEILNLELEQVVMPRTGTVTAMVLQYQVQIVVI